MQLKTALGMLLLSGLLAACGPNRALFHASRAIAWEPNPSRRAFDLYLRAQIHKALHQPDESLRDYDEAIRIVPNYAVALSGSAWLRATCPDERFRDGKKAVEHASKACELAQWKDFDSIDTLAAAHAEAGDFDKAIELETKALDDPEWAKANGDGGRKRLAMYREKKPYRQG